MLMTPDELRAWTLAANAGDSTVYFIGYLGRQAQEEVEALSAAQKKNAARRLDRLPTLPLPKTPTLDLQCVALELAGYRYGLKSDPFRWCDDEGIAYLTLVQRKLGVGRYEYIARRRATAKSRVKRRSCLSCGGTFTSEAEQNRMCPACLKVAA